MTWMGLEEGGGDAKGRRIPPNGSFEEEAVEEEVGRSEVVVRRSV